jgi:hypothetical protein
MHSSGAIRKTVKTENVRMNVPTLQAALRGAVGIPQRLVGEGLVASTLHSSISMRCLWVLASGLPQSSSSASASRTPPFALTRHYSGSNVCLHQLKTKEGTFTSESAAATTEEGQHTCWSCGACVNTFNLFCGKCEYIQPLQKDEVNYFQLLKV